MFGRLGRMKIWTKDEEEIIKEHYPVMDTKLLALRLNVSMRQLHTKAYHLGIKKEANSPYCRRRVEEQFRNITSLDSIDDDEVKSVIVGSLLGDANIHPFDTGNTYLEEWHAKRQLFYLQWKAKILEPLGTKVSIYHQHRWGRPYQKQLYTTASLPLFAALRRELYSFTRGGEKTNYISLIERLDPMSLAVWIMDDGSYQPGGKGSLYINTDSMPYDQKKFAIKEIEKKFGLYPTSADLRIRFPPKEMPKLRSVVEPYFLEKLKYKLYGSKQKFFIDKEFSFDAAHYIDEYPGACCFGHGHLWRLHVTIRGEKDEDTGMVMDFKQLSEIVNKKIINKLDHKLINEVAEELSSYSTAENILIWIWNNLKEELPDQCELYELRLYESPTSFAVYRGGN